MHKADDDESRKAHHRKHSGYHRVVDREDSKREDARADSKPSLPNPGSHAIMAVSTDISIAPRLYHPFTGPGDVDTGHGVGTR